ncbi:MAG TPA: PBP1A family penicillin-binding protein [Caulobacteraceae bacterium]|nr:PBP1A family penicillin-binding protein [Caulobacteraceae bacterium]
MTDDSSGPPPPVRGERPPPFSHHPPIPPEKRLRAAATLIAVVLVTLFLWLSWALPVSRALEPLRDPTLVFVDVDGKPFARRGFQKAEPVDVRKLPDHVAEAVIAIEDRRFYRHPGIDGRAIVRALRANSEAGGVVQGGSTITQQLAKNSFLGPERSFKRKFQEALISLWIEVRLSKEQILSRYLSSVYFGDGMYGIRAASRHYFDKEPEHLTVGESAMLAGLIKAPSRLNPSRNLKASRERARVVLAEMVRNDFITQAEAKKAALPRSRARDRLPVGNYFVDWIFDEAEASHDARYGEVEVRTTVDGRLQRKAEQVIRTTLARRGGRLNATQAALVSMRCDGSVVAMVGGKDYRQNQYNRATQARRQPGSAFKLFVYLAAFRAGESPYSVIDGSPLMVANWTPRNYEGGYHGPTPIRDAFARSSNVAAVRLQEGVGRRNVIRAARDLGIRTPLEPTPSLALGSYETTLLQLTSAYAGVRSGTYPVEPTGLAGRDGAARRPWWEFPKRLDARRERGPLLEVMRAVVAEGTGRAASLGDIPAFGKTGTTQDYRDALFIGFAGDLVTGVWVGNDDQSSMRGVTGGSLPAEIWREYMKTAMAQPRYRSGRGCAPLDVPRPAETVPLDQLPPLPLPEDVYAQYPPVLDPYGLPPELPTVEGDPEPAFPGEAPPAPAQGPDPVVILPPDDRLPPPTDEPGEAENDEDDDAPSG